MTFAFKLLSAGSIATGVVGAGITGTYYSSLETIGNKLKGKVLGDYDPFKSTWEHKFKKLKESGKSLKNVKDGREMSLYCQKNYSSTYKSIFSGKEDIELLEETKRWCTQTFKDQLEISFGNGGKVLDVDSETTDATEFKENYKKLKDHKETEGPLPKKLKDLAPNANSEAENRWKELQLYCKEIHKSYLTIQTLEDFKVAKKYCIKAGT